MTPDAYVRKLKAAIAERFDRVRQGDATAGAILHFAGALAQDYLEHYGKRPPVEATGVVFQPNGTTTIKVRLAL